MGKECDEVFKEAILNTYFMSPPRIYRWEQMIFNPEYEGESFMNLGDKCELKKDAMGNCLSTTENKWCSCSVPAGSGRTIGIYAGFRFLYGVYQCT